VLRAKVRQKSRKAATKRTRKSVPPSGASGSSTAMLAESARVAAEDSLVAFQSDPVGYLTQLYTERLEEAARDLGASAFGAFWHVTLPLIAPAVAAGS